MMPIVSTGHGALGCGFQHIRASGISVRWFLQGSLPENGFCNITRSTEYIGTFTHEAQRPHGLFAKTPSAPAIRVSTTSRCDGLVEHDDVSPRFPPYLSCSLLTSHSKRRSSGRRSGPALLFGLLREVRSGVAKRIIRLHGGLSLRVLGVAKCGGV